MQSHIHHAHLFSSNLDAALKFYQEMFEAEILADLDLAGARNVFIGVFSPGWLGSPVGNQPVNITPNTSKGVAMSLFGKILEKLGFSNPAEVEAAPQAAPAAPSAPAPIAVVDVVAQLEKLAASQTQKLNWRVSIVDLMKLLGLDSSFAARKELAAELGCPSEKMGDSAQMNMWLHKTVLQKLADNGGNIPKELLG